MLRHEYREGAGGEVAVVEGENEGGKGEISLLRPLLPVGSPAVVGGGGV